MRAELGLSSSEQRIGQSKPPMLAVISKFRVSSESALPGPLNCAAKRFQCTSSVFQACVSESLDDIGAVSTRLYGASRCACQRLGCSAYNEDLGEDPNTGAMLQADANTSHTREYFCQYSLHRAVKPSQLHSLTNLDILG